MFGWSDSVVDWLWLSGGVWDVTCVQVMTPSLKKLMKKRSSSTNGESKTGLPTTMKQALD